MSMHYKAIIKNIYVNICCLTFNIIFRSLIMRSIYCSFNPLIYGKKILIINKKPINFYIGIDMIAQGKFFVLHNFTLTYYLLIHPYLPLSEHCLVVLELCL